MNSFNSDGITIFTDMKWGILFIGLVLNSNTLLAQRTKLHQTICVLNHIPLLIESDPVIYQWNNQSRFEMGPGRISVRLATRKVSMEFDHLIQLNPPMRFDQQEALHVFLSADSSFSRVRRLLSPNSDLSIIDTVLTLNKSLYLLWKDKKGRIIQTIGFIAQPLIPKVIGFRVIQFYDSIGHSYKAKRIKYNKDVPLGYQQMNGNTIEVEPGGKLELKLQTYSLLTDTVVYYRLTNRKEFKHSPWKMTGHVLALPELMEGREYDLAFRYPNQSENIIYHIHVRPFWYQLFWVQVGGLVLLVLFVIFLSRHFYQRRYRRMAEQRQRLEEQLTTIQSQLNPHFIFNALSSIEGLVSQGHTEEANHYLSIFSSIMRETMDNSDKMLISLEEELVLIEKYLQIEQLRFGFQYKIHIQEGMSLSSIEVPPILIQPAIENAVKHGVAGLGANGLIHIAFTQLDSSLFVTVGNNSSQAIPSQVTAGGHGLAFTRQRIQHLNKLFPTATLTFSLHFETGRAEAVFAFKDWLG